ncbi:MAG: DegT/DnrJ/EryC1/StrS family aminotransferase [Bacteroidales bacterium]|nr:DegT/DnrJ/EryC1/StrS family aminotransferase [Bacteroidales bacterium]
MEFLNGYIKQAPAFRSAAINISPFGSDDVFRNNYIWRNYKADGGALAEVNGLQAIITESATSALDMILDSLLLNANDEVWIVTTSGNSYISGCVTRTIEKYCRWSRHQNAATAVILVNHEFGFIYRDMAALKDLGFPLIEDAAYSMYSQWNGVRTGSIGDYAIFSMAKMFPMQAGGLLFSSKEMGLQSRLTEEELRYFQACFGFYHQYKEQIIKARLEIYRQMTEAFSSAGFLPRFEPQNGEVPGAFLFKAEGHDLEGLKHFLQAEGIECSVFYGEEAFYLPCHQNMTQGHIDYLLTLVKDYLL